MSIPVNPKLFDSYETGPTPGTDVTLRDLFAAAALAGLLSNERLVPAINKTSIENESDPQTVSSATAYEFADAMLTERAKGGE